MRDFNIGVTQLSEEITDLANARKISESIKYDMLWRLSRVKNADDIDSQLIITDIRAEIRRLALQVDSFSDIMESRGEKNKEKKWQNKVRQERRGKVK